MKSIDYFEHVAFALKQIVDKYRSQILYYDPVEINGKVIAVRAILKNHKYVKYNNYDNTTMLILDYIEF